MHVFGDVTPEEAEAFNQAESNVKSMQQIKKWASAGCEDR